MNLTITVDPGVLKRARLRAVREDTSVNAVLRNRLAAYAQGGALRDAAEEAAARGQDAVESLIRLSQALRPPASPTATGVDGRATRAWSRDDLYDR